MYRIQFTHRYAIIAVILLCCHVYTLCNVHVPAVHHTEQALVAADSVSCSISEWREIHVYIHIHTFSGSVVRVSD